MNTAQYRSAMTELLQMLRNRRTIFSEQLKTLQTQNQQAHSVDELRTVSKQTLTLLTEFHNALATIQQTLKQTQTKFEQAQAQSVRTALLS